MRLRTTISVVGISAALLSDSATLSSEGDAHTAAGAWHVSLAEISSQKAQSAELEDVFRSDLLQVTFGKVAVAADNRRASLSIVIQNTSPEPIHIGIERDPTEVAAIGLADDRATQWAVESVSGIQLIRTLLDTPAENYTFVAPEERITVVMHFYRTSGESTPANAFSVTARGIISLPGGPRRISIGHPGIDAVARPGPGM